MPEALRKYLLTTLGILCLVVVLVNSKIWQRQPVVFYEPIIYPIEVIEGDRIIFLDETQLVIQHDMEITAIEYHNGLATIKGTRRINLWEYIRGTD